jgi:hypothetical protein
LDDIHCDRRRIEAGQGYAQLLEMGMTARDQAHEFLRLLERELIANLPPPRAMRQWIEKTVTESQTDHKRRHLRKPEFALLNGQVLPVLSKLLRSQPDCAQEADARRALLNEFHPSMQEISTHSPARTLKHPFSKVMGKNPREIYARWAGQTKKPALIQSWPDFALRRPFPHKVVFEGKYFPSGSLDNARVELVKDIYQAFFYRGLPIVPEGSKGRAAWDYDYGCLLAYDGSQAGSLRRAWTDLPAEVRSSFWSGANIYVMILGGNSEPV